VPTLSGVSERLATQRLERLEQDIADVDRALATLEELHAQSKGRGGAEAAERIRAVVGAERFPAEPQLPAEPQRSTEFSAGPQRSTEVPAEPQVSAP